MATSSEIETKRKQSLGGLKRTARWRGVQYDLADKLNELGIFAYSQRNKALWVVFDKTSMNRQRRSLRYSSVPGCSDVTGMLPGGRRLDIAVLFPRQPCPTRDQILFLNAINKNGGVGIYCNSIQSAIEQLQELGYLKKEEVADEKEDSGNDQRKCPRS